MMGMTSMWRSAAMLGLLLGVAGCSTDDEAAAPATPAAPAANSAANAQPPVEGTPPAAGIVRLSECETPADGVVHFKISDQVLAVPAGSIRDAVPAGLQRSATKETANELLQSRIAEGGGCPSNPLEVFFVATEQPQDETLLAGPLGIMKTTSQSQMRRFAQLTQQMINARDSANCREMGVDLIGCVGTETLQGRKTRVMYVITTVPGEVMNTGGPLAARCVLSEESIKGCALFDELSGGLSFDATLSPGTYTTTALKQAYASALDKINTLSR